MTEATQVNGAIRSHLGPLGLFIRMEHAFDVGVADWYYQLRGAMGWIEAKLIVKSGRRPDHFTREQLMWGEAIVAHGGRWHLLGLRDPQTWVLYDAYQARAWFDNKENKPLVSYNGSFPTRLIALALAPRRTACP